MSRPGWLNLDAPNDTIFGGESPSFAMLKLSPYQRILGFSACYIGGLAVQLVGAILLFLGATGAFATLFGVGAILSLVGTGFLVTFEKQLKSMFELKRLVATVLLIASIVMCFVSAFILPAILCIVFVIVEYLCFLWYSLSYIPYARTLVSNIISSLWKGK